MSYMFGILKEVIVLRLTDKEIEEINQDTTHVLALERDGDELLLGAFTTVGKLLAAVLTSRDDRDDELWLVHDYINFFSVHCNEDEDTGYYMWLLPLNKIL